MVKRIVIATIGTQGDVQPVVALGTALQRRGHDVTLASSEDFAGFSLRNDLPFASLGRSMRSFLTTPAFQNAMSRSMVANAPRLLREAYDIEVDAARALRAIAADADALVLNMNTSFGIDIGEALDIPAIMMAPQPLHPTRDFPLCAYNGPTLGGSLNRASYSVMGVQQKFYNFARARLRKEMGLQPARSMGFFRAADGEWLTTLYCFSPSILARPSDWPDAAHITGYWRLEDTSNWTPPAPLQAFLDAGAPPVYVGFGSMPFRAAQNAALLAEAAKRWGGRMVISRGWGGLDLAAPPDNVFVIDDAPHDRLFPLMQAVVHHGGAGTSSAAFYAGRPTMALPQTVDQPFWGRLIHQLGCGPAPIPLRRLTVDALVAALVDLSTNKAYAAAAERLRGQLLSEDGPAVAADIIEHQIDVTAQRKQRAA